MTKRERDKWVRLPSAWMLDENRLVDFHHKNGLGDQIMALMCLTVIVHEAHQSTGYARVTYDQFEAALGKSRSLISRGLQVLHDNKLIKSGLKRSEYLLPNFDMDLAITQSQYRWAKLPCRSMYNGSTLTFFSNLSLRSRTELDAMKLMYLFAALRDRKLNIAMISYEKIPERTGIPKERIKKALSLLMVNGIVVLESMPSTKSFYGIAQGYRLAGIESYLHAGTIGRGLLTAEFGEQGANIHTDF